MKKLSAYLALGGLFVFMHTTINAQKCEITSDPVTGEKICQFEDKRQTLKFKYTGGEEILFQVTFSFPGEQNSIIDKGTELIMKLENGTIIDLLTTEKSFPQTKVYASSTYASVSTWYTFTFDNLSKKNVEDLAKNKIIFFRYPHPGGGTKDADVKRGKIYIKRIMKGANCILENMNSIK